MAPGDSVVLPFTLHSAGNRMSCTSVLLPEPDTPVTTTRWLSGNSTDTFFRLCSRAPSSSRRGVLGRTLRVA